MEATTKNFADIFKCLYTWKKIFVFSLKVYKNFFLGVELKIGNGSDTGFAPKRYLTITRLCVLIENIT